MNHKCRTVCIQQLLQRRTADRGLHHVLVRPAFGKVRHVACVRTLRVERAMLARARIVMPARGLEWRLAFSDLMHMEATSPAPRQLDTHIHAHAFTARMQRGSTYRFTRRV